MIDNKYKKVKENLSKDLNLISKQNTDHQESREYL